jgi:hypothetical protein
VAFAANEETWHHFRVVVYQHGFLDDGKFSYAVVYKIVTTEDDAFKFILK